MRYILQYIIFVFLFSPLIGLSQQLNDTIIINKNNSPFFISKDFIVADTSILIIEKGSEILLSDSVNITVYGKLTANGTKKEPVFLKTQNDSISWGRLIIKTKEKTKIRYANFVNGAISTYDAKVYIANSNFYFYHNRKFDGWAIYYPHNTNSYYINNKIINYSGRYVGEGINVVKGEIFCANNYIENIPDAIELTGTNNSFVIGNFIKNSWDDAIDINGCKNVEIKNNTIQFIDDKAISVGRNILLSTGIKIEENYIRKAKYSFSIKDSSNVEINRNVVINTETGLELYQKTENSGGGFADLRNNIFIKNKRNLKIDDFSISSITNCISDKEEGRFKKLNFSVDTINYLIFTNDSINSDEFYHLNRFNKAKHISEMKIPVIFINTFPKTIIDDERINAEYEIFNNEIKSSFGNLTIEIRGTSSSEFPKKSYGISLDKKQNIFAIPESKDWVLYGPWYDKSLLRNAFAYSIGNELNIKSPEFNFINLFVNRKNEGLYLLVQKIKRSKGFVNVEKMSDLAVDGGYIFKIDKGTGANNWKNICTSDSSKNIVYYTHYPKPKKITRSQTKYLKNYIKNCEKNLYKTPVNLNAIDINSFVDYVIISELMKNFDAYRASVYFYKYRDDQKLYIGPIWDFNISAGNSYIDDMNSYKNFAFENTEENRKYIANWWYNLLSDKEFAGLIKTRWKKLRNSNLSNSGIEKLINELSMEIADYSDNEQIELLKNWLINRANWLDDNIENIDISAKIYYHKK